MITRIEIDGFKSFKDFKLDLSPFQVIIGRNGVGKSNLFDTITLLSKLATDSNLYDILSTNRGDVREIFGKGTDGTPVTIMTFAIEMLIDQDVTDLLGITEQVSTNRLRYEVQIEYTADNLFVIKHESLNPIGLDDDNWSRRQMPTEVRKKRIKRSKGRRGAYISTERDGAQVTFNKHQDGRSGKVQGVSRALERTVLSTITSSEFPTAYAVRQEMLNWKFLQLDPVALRKPLDIRRSQPKSKIDADASNLAAILWRMKQTNPDLLKDVSLDMVGLVPDLLTIDVQQLPEREELLIEARMKGLQTFSSRVLSDGTLRLLTLVTLKHDPLYQGVLCLEEPENGVHPSRLERVVKILKTLATDLSVVSDEQDFYPLRQVIVNTHSPKFASYTDMRKEDLLFAWMLGSTPRHTEIYRVENSLLTDPQLRIVAFNEVKKYMETETQVEFLEALKNLI